MAVHKHYGQLDISAHNHDAADLTGTISGTNLEGRLANVATSGNTITDWNDVIENGWYAADDAANAPAEGWLTGHVISHDGTYAVQVLRESIAEPLDGSDSKTWRRIRAGGIWGTWRRVYSTGPELDARYSMPTGSVSMFAGASTPAGWLLCDGTEKAIATYPALYAALTASGTAFPYGTNTNGSGGAGSTHFRVPNLKGRVPVGRDTGQTEFDTLGETGGAKAHTLTVAEMPTHSHGLTQVYTTAGGVGVAGVTYTSTSDVTGPAGGGGAHNNLQPYLVLNYIIKS